MSMREWSYEDGKLTLFEQTHQYNAVYGKFDAIIYTYRFSSKKDTLIFVDNGSADFRYVNVKD